MAAPRKYSDCPVPLSVRLERRARLPVGADGASADRERERESRCDAGKAQAARLRVSAGQAQTLRSLKA
jgi:hypothetical protein